MFVENKEVIKVNHRVALKNAPFSKLIVNQKLILIIIIETYFQK